MVAFRTHSAFSQEHARSWQSPALGHFCPVQSFTNVCSEAPCGEDFISWTSRSEVLSSLSCFLPVPGCLLRWRPMISASSRPRVTSSPRILAGPSDLLLTKRNQHEWWAVTLEIRLPKTVTLVLAALSGFLSRLLTPMKQAAILWAVLWRGKAGKVGSSLWPSVALSVLACQELNPANYYASEPRKRYFPYWTFR